MGATTGIKAIGNYAGAANDAAAVAILLALVPNPDAPAGAGPVAGTGSSYLDEMSPAAAAQLRVELTALSDAIDTTNTL